MLRVCRNAVTSIRSGIVGREDSERRGQDRGNQAGGGSEQQRAPRAPGDLREDVRALVARAEHVVQRRALARIEQRELGRLARGHEQRRE